MTDTKTHTRLLLLARRFPFNHGEVAAESYLETEIGILARHFDEIVAVGTEAAMRERPTCVLPPNVRPIALGCGNSKTDKITEAAQGLFLRKCGQPRIRVTFHSDSAANTMRKRIFLDYFVARAYRKHSRLHTMLRRHDFIPTHIYSFWLWDTALSAAWLMADFPSATAFSRAHRYDLYEERSPLHYLPLREYLLDRLDWVFPCSNDGRNYINEKWPGHETEVRTAYLGTRNLPDRSNVAAGDVLRVVSCSRVVPVKRVGIIADAMTLLDANGMNIEWTHYGDGEQLAGVKAKAMRLSHVHAEFPGNVPNAALLEEYARRNFDLFVNASESEGLPISLMEACGIGIPVLATDVGGTQEIVRSGVDGELLPENLDARQLADAIKRFAALPADTRMNLRRGARKIWEENFRTENNVNELMQTVNTTRGGDE